MPLNAYQLYQKLIANSCGIFIVCFENRFVFKIAALA